MKLPAAKLAPSLAHVAGVSVTSTCHGVGVKIIKVKLIMITPTPPHPSGEVTYRDDHDDNDYLTQVDPTLAGIAACSSTSESLRVGSVTMGHTWDVEMMGKQNKGCGAI